MVCTGANDSRTMSDNTAISTIPRTFNAGIDGARRYRNGQSSSGVRSSPVGSTVVSPILLKLADSSLDKDGGAEPNPLIVSFSLGGLPSQKKRCSSNWSRIASTTLDSLPTNKKVM